MDTLTVREAIVLAVAALAGLALVFVDERKRRSDRQIKQRKGDDHV